MVLTISGWTPSPRHSPQTCFLSVDQATTYYPVSNERREAQALQRGVILKLRIANPWPDIGSYMTKKNIQGHYCVHISQYENPFLWLVLVHLLWSSSSSTSGYRIERRSGAISRHTNTMCKTISISEGEMEWNQALDLYRSRDRIGKSFEHMKTDLE